MSKTIEEREWVVIRFAGDSGDGMQLAGSRFTDATAVLGNDLATLPNFKGGLAHLRANPTPWRALTLRSPPL